MSHPGDEAVAAALREQRWEVLTKGWPDLLCVRPQAGRGGFDAMAVELKRGKDRLTPEQQRVGEIFLGILGVTHYVVRDGDLDWLLRKHGQRRKLLHGVDLNLLRLDLEYHRRQAALIERRIETTQRFEEIVSDFSCVAP